jgi:uncharacterized protein GlcG (DUF336 family)
LLREGIRGAGLGRSSSLVRVRTEERALFMQYLIRASADQIFPEGGGMLIRERNGEVIGAVGLKTNADCSNMVRRFG